MFTYEKRIRALQMYEQTQSVTETVRKLGYPGRETLYKWIREQGNPPKEKSRFRGENTKTHPRHPPVKLKLEVLRRCFELGEDVKSVSEEVGYSRASIYTWRRKYLQKGRIALMNPKDAPRGKLVPGTASSTEELDALKAEVQDLQMQIDILNETIHVIKKDPSVNQTTLRNWEKATIIDALKNTYSLPKLLRKLDFPRSSYYYQKKAMKQQDKYRSAKELIRSVFEENHRCYGYR